MSFVTSLLSITALSPPPVHKVTEKVIGRDGEFMQIDLVSSATPAIHAGCYLLLHLLLLKGAADLWCWHWEDDRNKSPCSAATSYQGCGCQICTRHGTENALLWHLSRIVHRISINQQTWWISAQHSFLCNLSLEFTVTIWNILLTCAKHF